MNKYKIGDLVDDLGVSRSTINRVIDQLDKEMSFKEKYIESVGDKRTSPKLINEDGKSLIKQTLGIGDDGNVDDSGEADLIAELRAERDQWRELYLDERDKTAEYAAKFAEIAGEVPNLADQAQRLQLKQMSTVDEQAGQIADKSDGVDADSENKQGFWKRIFG
ncbi:hypothetical protein [Weissella soli]|uniref:hypothetical protein n=1 Tax=Weissella soli TaxID=155866 RepID=UPI001F319F28|nr:hypothetical protein [Weissella soli]GJM48996.1 hypothetical protein WSSLDB02_15530 [Weissella soli]